VTSIPKKKGVVNAEGLNSEKKFSGGILILTSLQGGAGFVKGASGKVPPQKENG